MTTPGSLASGGLPVGFTSGNVDVGGQLEANNYWVTPSSAQLSGWLAATMDPMAASVTTGSASLPASNAFVGGLVYLPAPVSSTGMSIFCVCAERRHRQQVLGRAPPGDRGHGSCRCRGDR